MKANAEFRTYLLAELEARGPLRSRQLEEGRQKAIEGGVDWIHVPAPSNVGVVVDDQEADPHGG